MKSINFENIGCYLLLISVILIASSCKKLIEIPASQNQLPVTQVFSDSADIIASVAAVYGDFNLSYNDQEFGNGAITIYTGLTSDELIPGADIYVAPAFYNNNILPNNYNVGLMWTNAYASIFQINACLEGITATNAISAGLKQSLIGELKLDRAFYYFNMVNIWGGVPIITSTDYNITQHIPRSSVDSIYSFILSDLTTAQNNLTATYPSDGHMRPNLYVAQSLLAKVYLSLGQYQNSINAANSVIGSGVYSLTTDLNQVFLDGSQEAIWQLPASGSYSATPEAAAFVPSDPTFEPNYVISPILLNSFETGDQRESNWTSFNTVNNGSTDSVYYYPFKYKNLLASQTPIEDYMIFRLADIYLVRAEALAETSKFSAALSDMNMIRARAGLNAISPVGQDNILKAIMHERQVEMFCEWGNRWYDLKRTNTINTVLSQEKPSWAPSAALFPIPTAELQSNPSLKQNPGY